MTAIPADTLKVDWVFVPRRDRDHETDEIVRIIVMPADPTDRQNQAADTAPADFSQVSICWCWSANNRESTHDQDEDRHHHECIGP